MALVAAVARVQSLAQERLHALDITNIKYFKNNSNILGFLSWLSRLRTRLVSMRMWIQSLALLSELRIQCCSELQCRSQIWLGFGVAVAVV